MGNYNLEILTLERSRHINNLLDGLSQKDIHCCLDYMKLFQDYLGAKVVYLFYGNDTNYILLPYFERPINGEYADIASPWYYGGPVHNFKDEKSAQDAFNNFIREFEEYCKANNIVSEFQRLNPIFNNHKLFQKSANLIYNRKIIYIDLRKEHQILRNEYSRHSRKNINTAHRNKLRVNLIAGDKIDSNFLDLYYKSMDRKKADDFYYFNETFFGSLFKTFKNDIKLFQVEYENKIIASSIELGKYGILYDYLRGTNPEYLHLRPNDLLIDEIIKWAKSNDYQYFVLGGGNSPSLQDGLFKFKKSFSSTTAEFYTYRKIHNLEKYKELCAMIGKKPDDLEYEHAQFFPEYRMKRN